MSERGDTGPDSRGEGRGLGDRLGALAASVDDGATAVRMTARVRPMVARVRRRRAARRGASGLAVLVAVAAVAVTATQLGGGSTPVAADDPSLACGSVPPLAGLTSSSYVGTVRVEADGAAVVGGGLDVDAWVQVPVGDDLGDATLAGPASVLVAVGDAVVAGPATVDLPVGGDLLAATSDEAMLSLALTSCGRPGTSLPAGSYTLVVTQRVALSGVEIDLRGSQPLVLVDDAAQLEAELALQAAVAAAEESQAARTEHGPALAALPDAVVLPPGRVIASSTDPEAGTVDLVVELDGQPDPSPADLLVEAGFTLVEVTTEPGRPSWSSTLLTGHGVDVVVDVSNETGGGWMVTYAVAPTGAAADPAAGAEALVAVLDGDHSVPFPACGSLVPAPQEQPLALDLVDVFVVGGPDPARATVTLRTTGGRSVIGQTSITGSVPVGPVGLLLFARDGVVVGRGYLDPEHVDLVDLGPHDTLAVQLVGAAAVCTDPVTDTPGPGLPAGRYEIYGLLEVALKEVTEADGTAVSRSDLIRVLGGPAVATVTG